MPDDEKKDEDKKDEDDTSLKMLEVMASVNKNLEGMAAKFGEFGEKLDGFGVKDDEDEGDEDKGKDDYSYDDLETLDRRGFMDVIVKKVTGAIDSKLKPVTESLNTIDSNSKTQGVEVMIKAAVEKYPDFWEWKAEMGEEVKRNDRLTAEDAYVLAKQKDPDKVKKLAEAANKGKDKEEDVKDVDQPFGGLTPTSGKTVPTEKMTSDQAAEMAWTKVFGSKGAP